MLRSLEASHCKLSEYYEKTKHMQGHFHALCTILAPDNRFRYFRSDEWSGAKELRGQYRRAFRDALTPIQKRLATPNSTQESSESTPRSRLYNWIRSQRSISGVTSMEIKMTEYLDGNVTDSEPLDFRKENEARLPHIAALARDLLAIPATGAGMERLFNTARDVFHRRRRYLEPDDAEDLMMKYCTTRFDVKTEHQEEFEKYFGSNEIDTLMEERLEKPGYVNTDEISDTEEQGDEPTSGDLTDIDEGPEDGDAILTTPAAPNIPAQVRTSGRKRKHIEDALCEDY
ncbi:unnamed protein product [Penicillium salamii]|uniref:HAT C-terminal dimerisation domain-containing protein n=1 Tax=Penicillium salamii TaxID=1612424 RepID=A0A9W4N498_9EURO|nr:unnamed protein product [Penicillium salamii]